MPLRDRLGEFLRSGLIADRPDHHPPPRAFSSLDRDPDGGGATPATYVIMAAFYVVSAHVAILLNTALVSQAHLALEGGDPTVAGGPRPAGSMAGRPEKAVPQEFAGTDPTNAFPQKGR